MEDFEAEFTVEPREDFNFVFEFNIASAEVEWGSITGTLDDQTDLADALDTLDSQIADNHQEISNIHNTIQGYGDIVSYNAADFATKNQGLLAESALQPNDNISLLNNNAGYITNADLPTLADLTTPAQLSAINSGATSAKIGQIAINTQAISTEITNRQNADNNLQTQIDAIVASSDVFDIVGTYAELQAYDISTVPVNDIIKVLVDSTHSNAATYYRCVETGGVKSWSYVGSEGAYYTKSEADGRFVTNTSLTTILTDYVLSSDLSTTLANYVTSANLTTILNDYALLTDIPTVGNGTITINQGGVQKGTFTSNQSGNTTINLDAGGGSSTWGSITGTLSNQTDLQDALDEKQDVLTAGENITIAKEGGADITDWSEPTEINIDYEAGDAEYWVYAYGDNKFVAMSGGGSGYVSTSTDGITWNTPVKIFDYADYDADWYITYGNNKFVAVAHNSGYVSTSTDGTTWTTPVQVLNPNVQRFWFLNDKFFVSYHTAAYTDVFATSTDGITWTTPVHPSAFDGLNISGMAYGNGEYVALGFNVTGENFVIKSTDAINWDTPVHIVDLDDWNSWDLYFDGTKFFGINYSDIMTSTDGTTWTTPETIADLDNFDSYEAILVTNNELYIAGYDFDSVGVVTTVVTTCPITQPTLIISANLAVNGSEVATKDDINALVARIAALEANNGGNS